MVLKSLLLIENISLFFAFFPEALSEALYVHSFTLLMCGDLQTIKHIAVKYILDDYNFYKVTFSKQLKISNFD